MGIDGNADFFFGTTEFAISAKAKTKAAKEYNGAHGGDHSFADIHPAEVMEILLRGKSGLVFHNLHPDSPNCALGLYETSCFACDGMERVDDQVDFDFASTKEMKKIFIERCKAVGIKPVKIHIGFHIAGYIS